MARISIVMTVKNETVLLVNNIKYHRYLGVEKFYIYFDNGFNDAGYDLIKDFPDVVCLLHPDLETYAGVSFLQGSAKYFDTQVMYRQPFDIHDAMIRSRAVGIEWLIPCDPDELIYLEDRALSEGELRDYFDEIPLEIDQVIFAPREIVTRRMAYKNVFAEETLFKKTERKFPKIFYEKMNGRFKIKNGKYGHIWGKAAARLSSSVVTGGVHYFLANSESSEKAPSIKVNGLLHYYAYDYSDFIKKFRNFKGHFRAYPDGVLPSYKKLLWVDVVNHPDYTEDDIAKYFQRWVCFSWLEIFIWKLWGVFVEIPDAVRIFKEIEAGESGD
jgi:hypothetical protein